MKPPPFEYLDPRTAAEAISLLQQHEGEAKILAGGQSLMPLLNMRMARPGILIDLAKVTELNYVRAANGGLAIGAMTTKRSIEDSELVQKRQPLLHAATLLVAHPQIRNRGTLGGSMAHADPAAEYPAVAIALDAEFRVLGPRGERSISARDFFVTYLTTALEPAEVLTEVRLPALSERSGWSFIELARRHGDFALAGVAATLDLERGGQCSSARIVLFGIGPTALRVEEAEQSLIGERPSESLFQQAAKKASEAIDEPLSDIHASGEYRRHLARVLTRRALTEAATRARA